MLEYDEDDQYITRQHFQKYETGVELVIVNSSADVVSYLEECRKGQKKMPSLLLLNYNSTPLNAAELVGHIKNDRLTRHIPAVVLSGTLIPGIVKECYENGASSFIQKPAMMDETDQKIARFIDYWIRTVELP
jgi:two-component system, response regulator